MLRRKSYFDQRKVFLSVVCCPRGIAKNVFTFLCFKHLTKELESRLNSRAIFRVTHPTPLLSLNLKFSLPVYLEQCLGYLNVCIGMKPFIWIVG